MDRSDVRTEIPDAATIRARNVRMGLILGSIALAFFVGVILKYVLR